MDSIFPVVRGVTAQHRRQVLGRGIGIPQVELNKLTFLQQLADGDRSGALVHPNHVANEEIALLRVVKKLIHYHSQKKGVAHQSLIALVQSREYIFQHRQGRLLVQLR